MTTIRRRLTFWYTVALGVTVLAFGIALYLERRRPACGSSTSGCCWRPIWRSGGSASPTTSWADRHHGRWQAGPRPGHQRLSGRGPGLPHRGGHGGPGARALGRDPRAGRGRPPALTAALDTLRTAKRSGTMDLGPPRGRARYLATRVDTRGPGRRPAGRRLARGCRVRPHRVAPLHAAHRPGDPRWARRLVGYWLAGTAPAGRRASWTRWTPSPTAGASTAGSRSRSPATRWRDWLSR